MSEKGLPRLDALFELYTLYQPTNDDKLSIHTNRSINTVLKDAANPSQKLSIPII